MLGNAGRQASKAVALATPNGPICGVPKRRETSGDAKFQVSFERFARCASCLLLTPFQLVGSASSNSPLVKLPAVVLMVCIFSAPLRRARSSFYNSPLWQSLFERSTPVSQTFQSLATPRSQILLVFKTPSPGQMVCSSFP